jgi:hypothetical protein
MSQSGLNIPNLDTLIAHLEAQPPERINMGFVAVAEREECGTCGCIFGHARLVQNDSSLSDHEFQDWLGLTQAQRWDLTMPSGWEDEKGGVVRYPAHRVIATLKRLRDRFLATGEVAVDWGPEPTEGQPWAAPQARELTPPALPETITRFLAAEPVTTGTEGR